MSDTELDKEWSTRTSSTRQRPQSTVARAFSASLDELFKIDNSIADLDAVVSQKKQAVSTQTSELEALEARLRATEERLKNYGGNNSPNNNNNSNAVSQRSPPSRPVLDTKTFENPSLVVRSAGNAQNVNLSGGRPASKRQDIPAMAMPDRLPPTPGASEEEDEDDEEDDDDDDDEEEESSEDEEQ